MISECLSGVKRKNGSPPRPRYALGRGGLGGGRFAPAWGAEVVSSNIVGYQKVTLQPGFNLIGVGFVKVGTGGDYALKDLFQGTDITSAKAGSGADNGDLIQLFDAGEQTYVRQYFFYTSNGEYPEYDNKWYDVFDDEEPTEDVIENSEGTGFWYQYRGTGTPQLTTAGEVSKESIEITIKPGFNCIVYPFPADFDFTKLDWKAAGATPGSGADNGDLIQVFDAEEQTYTTQYFFYTSGGEYPEYDNKWYDVFDDEEPTEATIPAGSGFWYQHRGNSTFTITLPSPIAD